MCLPCTITHHYSYLNGWFSVPCNPALEVEVIRKDVTQYYGALIIVHFHPKQPPFFPFGAHHRPTFKTRRFENQRLFLFQMLENKLIGGSFRMSYSPSLALKRFLIVTSPRWIKPRKWGFFFFSKTGGLQILPRQNVCKCRVKITIECTILYELSSSLRVYSVS
jgi:hypothetical protein